ncbi:MAG: M42 family peptidase [Desulfobacteraceae bacterium]|nr:MAG: M42 family peptidase [Desulfobacteraceae bacterium]
MFLEQLSNAPGVSGNEEAVRKIILDAIAPHVDQCRVDTLGNVLAVKSARRAKPRFKVMVAAHMDEIGFIVTGHDQNGGLRFQAVGGIDNRILPGKRVRIGPDLIPGVIGAKPIHLLEEEESSRVVKADAMVIDIGVASKNEALKAVPTGQYAHFATRFQRLGPTATGKAFDDRAGCAVLIELLKGAPFDFDLHAAFTVQEEVGLRGAQVAAFAIAPDCAFILEGTICDDGPKDKDISPTTRLGRGPALTIMDRSVLVNRSLVDHLIAAAESARIPYQFKQPGLGGTDAGATSRSKAGVPSVVMAIPCRYIHSPVSMLSLNDFRNTLKLLRAGLTGLKPETIKT